MSDQDKSKDKSEVTRRATFKLATAVAVFGAAMGMRANPAGAEEKTIGKGTKDGSSRFKIKMDNSSKSKMDDSSKSQKKGN